MIVFKNRISLPFSFLSTATAAVIGLMMAVVIITTTATSSSGLVSAETIVVGGQRDVGWREGVCYENIRNVMVGDVLRFNFAGHDVYRLVSPSHFVSCDFSDALVLAPIGTGPYEYTVTEEDANDNGGVLYFACSIGDHCAGGTQKVQVFVQPYLGQSLSRANEDDIPQSNVQFGLSPTQCASVHDGTATGEGTGSSTTLDTTCTEPVLEDDGKTWYTSCLSPPATLTPGGVINNLFVMQYPYPKDRRVLVGLRTWEFVADIPGSANGEVEPVPINQLYVHHLTGRVVLGQGTEGIRRSEPDAPYPAPYGVVTGQEGDSMVFHIIDLREVSDWLACIECRCNDPLDGTYLDITNTSSSEMDPFGVVVTGGVSCCTNCTDLTGPTVDYRMRYNVSYSYIEGDTVVSDLQMITADISPVVGKTIEYDVPNFQALPDFVRKDNDPTVQHLVRELPFNELFQMEFFSGPYTGPDTIRVFRCVGHLHVAAIGMWLYDAETGETICNATTTYGTNPSQDKGFLNAIHVDSYDEPVTFPADRPVRLVVDYNATEYHTGVMGMLFMFIDAERQITQLEAQLTIPLCRNDICDQSMLPPFDVTDFLTTLAEDGAGCEDALPSSPACAFGGLCDCDTVINAEESTGCGGVYTTAQGDIVVDAVCAKSCGCPSMSTCEDQLSNSPICNFGQICDCEFLVNQPESTGCGGVYSTEMGDVMIDDVCAAFCDACPEMEMNDADMVIEEFVELMEDDLRTSCLYATQDCRDKIHNLLSCGLEATGINSLDPLIRQAIVVHATRLASKYSQLGDSSLHLGQQVIEIGRELDFCSDIITSGEDQTDTIEDGTSGSENSNDNQSSSGPLHTLTSVGVMTSIGLFVCALLA